MYIGSDGLIKYSFCMLYNRMNLKFKISFVHFAVCSCIDKYVGPRAAFVHVQVYQGPAEVWKCM
jgi:hypothetical protein